MSAELSVETTVLGDHFRSIWYAIFPPRLSASVEADLMQSARDTTQAAYKVEKAFEGISNRAIAAGRDPIAILIHDVKGAKFQRQIQAEIGK